MTSAGHHCLSPKHTHTHIHTYTHTQREGSWLQCERPHVACVCVCCVCEPKANKVTALNEWGYFSQGVGNRWSRGGWMWATTAVPRRQSCHYNTACLVRSSLRIKMSDHIKIGVCRQINKRACVCVYINKYIKQAVMCIACLMSNSSIITFPLPTSRAYAPELRFFSPRVAMGSFSAAVWTGSEMRLSPEMRVVPLHGPPPPTLPSSSSSRSSRSSRSSSSSGSSPGLLLR